MSFKRFAGIGAVVGLMGLGILSAVPASASSVGTTVVPFISDSDAYYSATSPDGSHIAYSYYGADEVWLLNTATQVITVVSPGSQTFERPGDVVFSPDGATLYVANYGDEDNVLVVDVATATVTEELTSEDFSGPWTIEVSPDGDVLYIGDYSNDTFVVYNLVTDTTVDYPSVGSPYSMYSSADGSKVYNVDYYGQIDVFDTATAALTSWTDVSGDFYNTCVNSDHTVLYMPDYSGGSLYKVSLADGSILDSLDLAVIDDVYGGDHTTCEVSPDDAHVFLSDYSTGSVDEADPAYPVTAPGIIYQFRTSGLAFVQAYQTSGVAYTQQINFYDDCTAFIAGYYGNAQQFFYEEGSCATLPNTGVDTTALAVSGSIALAVLAAGTALVLVRRRTT